jgi:hypothetical protein
MRVLYGNVAPAAAVEAIESDLLMKQFLEEDVESEPLEDKPSRPDFSKLLEDDLDFDDPDEDRRF